MRGQRALEVALRTLMHARAHDLEVLDADDFPLDRVNVAAALYNCMPFIGDSTAVLNSHIGHDRL